MGRGYDASKIHTAAALIDLTSKTSRSRKSALPEDDETCSDDDDLPPCRGLPTHTTLLNGMQLEVANFMNKTISQESLESSFAVVDLGNVVASVKEWNTILPRVDPVFSIACNPNAGILSVLSHNFVAFSIGSSAEAPHVNSVASISPHSVIDTCNTRSDKYLLNALKNGVTSFVIDCVSDIARFARINNPTTRILIKVASSEEATNGASLETVSAILAEAKSKAVCVSGITMELSLPKGEDIFFSQLKSLVDSFSMASQAFNLAKDVEVTMSKIYFVGEFLNTILTSHRVDEKLTIAFNTSLMATFPEKEYPALQICADASTSLVNDAVHIAVNITGVKHGAKESMYYVDDGIYGSFHCSMIGPHADSKLRPMALNPSHPDQLGSSTVWGPTCDSLDVIGKGLTLPRMEIGEWMYFSKCGAFCMASGTSFNGVRSPEVKYVF